MRVSHSVSAVFDDPNLVSVAGLAPVLALAERAGLHELVAEHLTVSGSAGANTVVKIPALVAGMVAGADSIEDMDLLRHGGMGRLFTQVRAPTTLGTCLRGFTFGHVRQLDAIAARLLIALAKATPLLAGADQAAYLDIDDTMRETHGYAKQGVGYGYSKVKGLNALLAIVSTPIAAPVIAATRLRKGSTNSARGAARLVTDALIAAGGDGDGACRQRLLQPRRGAADAVLVSDFWPPYWNFDVVHAVCGAHLLRELTAAADVDEQASWATGLDRLLCEINRIVTAARDAGADRLATDLLGTYQRRYDDLITAGWTANPGHHAGGRGTRRRPKHVNLLDTHRDEVLRYAADLRVPFTNNGSERDVRPIKIRMKVAGCLRSMAGAEAFCRLRSYLSTARKQHRSAFTVLHMLHARNPWVPAIAG